MAMRPEHGKLERDRELLVILASPSICLELLSWGSNPSFLHHHQLFPANYLSTFYCLAADQLCTQPPLISPPQCKKRVRGPRDRRSAGSQSTAETSTATSYAVAVRRHNPRKGINYELSYYMILTLANMTPTDYEYQDGVVSGAFSGPYLSQAGPAILRFLRVVLTLPPGTLPHGMVDCISHGVACMCSLLQYRIEMIQPSIDPILVSTSDGRTDWDLLNLPMLVDPLRSAEALHADAMLLHALGAHIEADGSLRTACYRLQLHIIDGWAMTGSIPHLDPPFAAQDVMVQSLVGLAKQCMSHVLQMMRQLCSSKAENSRRREGSGRESEARHNTNTKTEKLADMNFAELGLDGVSFVWEVLHNTTMFLTYNMQQRDASFDQGG